MKMYYVRCKQMLHRYLLLYVIFKLNSKTTRFGTCVYMKFFLRFEVLNSFLKYVHAF